MMPRRPRWLGVGAALAVWAGLLASAAPAAAQAKPPEGRIALVIGNGSYTTAPLRNPVQDARAMARVLTDLGFEVIAHENIGHREMRRAIRVFGERLKDGGSGLFFFAGHGLSIGQRNFLVPVDAQIEAESDVPGETIDVNLLLQQLDTSRDRNNIVILDACADNPYVVKFRGGNRGLAQMEAPSGTLIAYATAPGRTARDGDQTNGVYTSELLKAMRVPGLKAEDVFKRVRAAVRTQTGGDQIPWEASLLEKDFYFKPVAGTPAPVAPAVAATTAAPPPPPPAPKPTIREEVGRGTLGLVASVEGAEIFVDGERVGEARSGRTLVMDNIAAGKHRVTARRAGHKDWEQEVDVPVGGRRDVRIELQMVALPPPPAPAPAPPPPRTVAPTPVPAPTPAEVKGGNLLHQINFVATRTETPKTTPPCATRYDETGLVVKNVVPERGTCEYHFWGAGRFGAAVRIELTTRLVSGPTNQGFGLKFAMPSREHAGESLYFMISGDGSFRLSDRFTKEWKAVVQWTKDPRVRPGYGSVNELAVEVSGRTIRLFVNGHPVSTTELEREPTGSVGLFLGAPDVEVAFGSLRVFDLGGGAPGRGDLAAAPGREAPGRSEPAAAAPGRRLLRQIDFVTSRDEKPKTTPPCATRYDSGGFVVRNVVESGTCEYNLWTFQRVESGTRIELATRLLAGPTNRGFGLKFAIAGKEKDQADDALYFMVSGDGSFQLQRYVGGWKPLIHWTKDTANVRAGVGQVNDLAVEVQGRTVRIFVNGKLVGTTQTDREASGMVGLFLDAPGLEVSFASLKVLELAR